MVTIKESLCDNNPWCGAAKACLSGAMKYNYKIGKVIVDEQRCLGCFACVAACPKGAITPS
jgi:carbon-monoxide dehydrogenase iron sulfur subunit